MSRNRILIGILAVSLGLKLTVLWAVAADPSRLLTGDAVSYHNSARALAEKGVFAVSPDRPDVPQTIRTPGYPAFLAASYALFGPHPVPAIAAQIVISLLTIVLVWRLAADRWGLTAAHLAATLLALDLSSFSHSLLLLTETLFTLLFTCVLFLATRFCASPAARRVALGMGLALALATLVRPISYYLVLPLGLWVAATARSRRLSPKQASIRMVLFVLPFLLLIGGWQWRNWQRTGSAAYCSIEGSNLLYYRGAGIVALRDGISIQEARERLGQGHYGELHPETSSWSPQQLSERWKREGIDLILRHPVIFARLMVRGVAATFLGTGEHTLMRLLAIPVPPTGPFGDLARLDWRSYLERWVIGRPFSVLATFLSLSYLALLYVAAASQVVRSLRRREFSLWDACVWGVFLYLVMIAAGPETYHRFRVPVSPILCLYAGGGLAARGANYERFRGRTL